MNYTAISPSDLFKCPCPVCASEKNNPVYTIKGFSIVLCADCGMAYVNPRLKDNVISEIYRKDYFQKQNYSFNDFGYGDYDLTAHLRDKTFLRWYGEVAPFLQAKQGTALDVGCATGRFLNILKDKGWNTSGLELDVDMSQAVLKKGFNVRNIPLEDCGPEEKYDLITLFDVIEHVTHLQDCFKNISRMLSNKGSVVMVTPNIDSFQKKLFGKRWFQFKPWEHISYFSPAIMRRLADAFGLKIVYLSDCGQYADMSFIHHRLLRYRFNRIAGIFNAFMNLPGLKNRAWYFGTGSMLMVMQKK